MKIYQKKILRYLMISFFIVSIFSCFISCTKKPKPESHEARVVFVMGNAEILHKEGQTEAVIPKMTVNKGDTIKTGSGFVLVQIGDDILIRIQSNTTTELSRLFEESETKLFLNNGQIISHVKKLTKKNDFKIQTPTAVASVRGTMYSVSYYKTRSVLAVREGTVELESTQKQNLVSAGNSLVINKNKSRKINPYESLEIKKISEIPYNNAENLNKDETYTEISRIAEEREEILDKEIDKNGGPIPRTLEDMLKKYGFLNRVILYNNKYYTGIITSRGATVKIMTLDGFESIPFRQIRNIKRTGLITE